MMAISCKAAMLMHVRMGPYRIRISPLLALNRAGKFLRKCRRRPGEALKEIFELRMARSVVFGRFTFHLAQ